MAALTGDLRGAVAICVAMALYTLNDMLLKQMAVTLDPGQIIVLRGAFALVLLGVPLILSGQFGTIREFGCSTPVLLRSACDAVSAVLFTLAFLGMPLATVTAMAQAVPALTALCGILLFRDRVTPWQAMAAGLALMGVLLVVRPTQIELGAPFAMAAGAVVLMVIRDVVTRLTPVRAPTLTVTVMTTAAIVLWGVPQVIWAGWIPIPGTGLLWIFLLSVLTAAGGLLTIFALRTTSFIVLAPFRHLSVFFAMLFGATFLGEMPTSVEITGMAIIVAAGSLALRGVGSSGEPKSTATDHGKGPSR